MHGECRAGEQTRPEERAVASAERGHENVVARTHRVAGGTHGHVHGCVLKPTGRPAPTRPTNRPYESSPTSRLTPFLPYESSDTFPGPTNRLTPFPGALRVV